MTMSRSSVPESGVQLVQQFRSHYAALDIHNLDSVDNFTDSLDNAAAELRNRALRECVGNVDVGLWKDLKSLWRDLVRAQLTFWDEDETDEEDSDSRTSRKQQSLRALTASAARFTRNIVAEIPENQIKAFESEPEIRRLLHYYTSWTMQQDNDAILAGRVLSQALSNLVTDNEVLQEKLWQAYMILPEDQAVLVRVLHLADRRTVLAGFHMVRNCTKGSKPRCKLLAKTPIGCRICIALLDTMVKLFEEADGSEGAQAFDHGYEIIAELLEFGLIPGLYTRLTVENEVVTPHQTTLLKLVDSYLQSKRSKSSLAHQKGVHTKICPMLAKAFFALSTYARSSIRRSLGSNTPSPTISSLPSSPESTQTEFQVPEYVGELDVFLPKVCEALVLVAQCMTTISLAAEEVPTSAKMKAPEVDVGANLKDYFNNKKVRNRGIPESLVDLLRLLDLFLPRINFGKPVTKPTPTTPPAPTAQKHVATQQPSATLGFQYLKRDLVRLLGILCHGAKAVQDRIRESGGIEVVMNLCVVDERNPYLREHAIFTLRNLLHANPENQAVVAEIQPSTSTQLQSTLQS